MSKFYKVKIEEKLSRNVIVKADSSDEAYEVIEDLCNNGIIDLNSNDFNSRQWKVIGEEKMEVNLSSSQENCIIVVVI